MPSAGRPKIDEPKKSVTVRMEPALIAKLDAFAAANFQDRTTILEIAAKAMIKRGYAKTIEDAKT